MKRYIIKRLVANLPIMALFSVFFYHEYECIGLITYFVCMIIGHTPEMVSAYRWHKKKGSDK